MVSTSQKHCYVVVGTDTNVGKTTICSALMYALRQQQPEAQVFTLKPVAAGCTIDETGQWRNSDVDLLMRYSSYALPIEQIAPIMLQAAASPHIAAALEQRRLQAARIVGFVRGAMSAPVSHILVEGAGGWLAPINERETMADVMRLLNIPVILVVGIKLGCLNHARLTYDAIIRSGLVCAGWVANCVEANVHYMNEQIDDLKRVINAPCLGEIPYMPKPLMVEEVSLQLQWPKHDRIGNPQK